MYKKSSFADHRKCREKELMTKKPQEIFTAGNSYHRNAST